MNRTLSTILLAVGLASTLPAQEPRMSYGIWVEDSLEIEFRFPRAWGKKVDRSPSSMTAEFAKDDEAVLRFDFQTRSGDWDVDRFVEETLDQFLRRHPDIRVIQEIRLEEGFQGFQEAHFLVAHYQEGRDLITNRFLFTRKNQNFYITQAKVLRKKYHLYKPEVDLFMKSVEGKAIPRNRWRNDSLNYLNPSSHETTIRYIRDSLRPQEGQQTPARSSLEYRPQPVTPAMERPTDLDPRRPIRDLEPGRTPPDSGIRPVSEPTPDPI